MLEKGALKLPQELAPLKELVDECDFKDDLYNCIANWYVETELAIDILRRI